MIPVYVVVVEDIGKRYWEKIKPSCCIRRVILYSEICIFLTTLLKEGEGSHPILKSHLVL